MIDSGRCVSDNLEDRMNEESVLLPHREDDDNCAVTETRPTSSRYLFCQVLAVVVNFATTGLLQSAIGALIVNMEAFYSLNHGPTAFIFPSALAGYLVAVTILEPLHKRGGRRALAFCGPLARLTGVCILMLGPRPFPVALLGYYILGFGTGLTDAGFCAWGANVPRTSVVQGIVHGAWSIGCVLGPLVASWLMAKHRQWFIFYRFATIPCLTELAILSFAFWPEHAASYKAIVNSTDETEQTTVHHSLLLKETWLCGLFWFVYEGIESSYGDWIITYMAHVRHVDAAVAASAASFFWIGMVVGRIALSPLTEYIGLSASVATYIILATLAQILFRVVHSVPVALSVLSVVGFLFGPLFPSGIVLLGRKLPVRAHVGIVSAASAVGQVGGATAPLIVGFMADVFGLDRLLDVVTALTVVLLLVWVWFCRAR